MSEIEIVPFEYCHLDTFDPGPFDRKVLSRKNLFYLKRDWQGRASTALKRGRTLGIAGASKENGTAEVWMVLSDELRQMHPFWVHRLAAAYLANLSEIKDVNEIQVTVHPEFKTGRNWLSKLKFEEVEITTDFVRCKYNART